MISRRQFVYGSALLAGGCQANQLRPDYPFLLGVASGDPTSDSVILWTRVLSGGSGRSNYDGWVDVSWEVALDPDFIDVLQTGTVRALPENAHCVHVDVQRLQANKHYWYRFEVAGERSPTGRTKTLPAPGTELHEFSIALASCMQYAQGYFSIYRDLLVQQPDIVIHNGDYIYESGAGPTRPFPIDGEATTLEDYRALYSGYRRDTDLQIAHAQFPWVVIWDDHEVVNDWGPEHFLPSAWNREVGIEDHKKRIVAARKAFLEFMPLRAALAKSEVEKAVLYQKSVVGDLVEICHLDVRSYRDKPVCNGQDQLRFKDCDAAHIDARSILGAEQEQWFFENFAVSDCRWNCISQTTLMAAFDRAAGPQVSFETDSWDNYPGCRKRILKHIVDAEVRNPVSLGGNIHAFYAGVVAPGYSAAHCDAAITEVVTSSVTAGGGGAERLNDVLNRRDENPCLQYFENRYRGYTLLRFSRERIDIKLRVVDDVQNADAVIQTLASLVIHDRQVGVTVN